jgi:Zn-dependent metalloprotease
MKRTYSAGLAAAALATTAGLVSAGGAQAAQPAGQAFGQVERGLAVASATSLAGRLGVTADGLVERDVIAGSDGTTHVRFDRTFKGLPVVGGDFVVHRGKGRTTGLTSGLRIKNVTVSTTTPSVSVAKAIKAARATVDFPVASSERRVVVYAVKGAPRLAYRIALRGRAADGEPQGRDVFVDARSGKVVDSWEAVHSEAGSGTGLFVGKVDLEAKSTGAGFELVDDTRGGNTTLNAGQPFTDDDNVWGDGTVADPQSAGVDAHYGIAQTWDYYKNVHGRNGIADDGKGAESFVHDGAYVNASWSDDCFCMKYGDGDATQGMLPLTALDVAGHEMSHGVTSRTANLNYEGESGGLNEATSDIFGSSVEFAANNAEDVGDYVIGEKIFSAFDPTKNYIRRMDKPSVDGSSLDCWTDKAGEVDVHYSSGIANHFFYMLSEGSGAKEINGVAYDSPTCDSSTLEGIGRDKAEKIWYKALTAYFTSTTNYAEARTGTISAATDLYGADSAEVKAVEAAWTAVDVPASTS